MSAASCLIYCLAGLVLAFGYLSNQSTCVWRVLFGLPCPACGMGHALIAIAVCDWRAAWQANPVSYAVAPLSLWVGVKKLKRSIR